MNYQRDERGSKVIQCPITDILYSESRKLQFALNYIAPYG